MTEGDPYLVSTIAQPTKQMAEVAVAKLIAVINGETVEKRTVLLIEFGEGGNETFSEKRFCLVQIRFFLKMSE